MFSNFFKVIFFIFFFTSTLFAEVVNKIIIDGNERISNQTVIVFSKIDIGQNLSETDLNQALINLYDTDFFKDVSLSFENNILNISVLENPIIQTLSIEGIKKKSLVKKLTDLINLKSRNSYKELFAEKDKNLILNGLRSVGYYFASVEYVVDYNDNNTVDLTYNVLLGDKATIKEIKFIGDKFFKDRKLLNVITSEENKFWKVLSTKKFIDQSRIALDQRLLKNYYLNRGFYNVDVKESYANMLDTNEFDLIFNINAGQKFFFNDFKLSLPKDYNQDNFSDLIEIFAKLKGKIYSLEKIETILSKVDKIALSDQYEFISASVNEEVVNKNKLNFTFMIKETEKKYVNRINLLGNNITRETFIRNKLIVDEGDPFNELLHNKSINELKASNIFAKVESEIVDAEEPGFKDINLIFEEKATGEISAGVGYGTRGAAVGFGITENNFLGKGVKLATDLSYSEDSLAGSFSYTEPNFAYTDKSLTSKFISSKTNKLSAYGYENKLNTLEFSTFYEQYEDFYVSPRISLRHENLSTNSTASEQYKKQKGKFFDLTIPYGVTYDKRDSSYQTKDGYISRFNQELPLISSNPSISNSYNYTKYFSISDDYLNSIDFYVKAINSISNKDVRVSKRTNLSGNRLRGFEVGKIGPIDKENYVGGNYAMALNFITKMPNLLPELQNVDFNFFVDMGNVWGVDYSSELDDNSGIRSAVGIGIDWFTPIGPLNFSLAQAITSEKTDKKESFRFNLGTTF